MDWFGDGRVIRKQWGRKRENCEKSSIIIIIACQMSEVVGSILSFFLTTKRRRERYIAFECVCIFCTNRLSHDDDMWWCVVCAMLPCCHLHSLISIRLLLHLTFNIALPSLSSTEHFPLLSTQKAKKVHSTQKNVFISH